MKLNKDLLKLKVEKSLDKIKDETIDMDVKNLRELKIFMKKVQNSTCDPQRK